jgi:hypothetical protein
MAYTHNCLAGLAFSLNRLKISRFNFSLLCAPSISTITAVTFNTVSSFTTVGLSGKSMKPIIGKWITFVLNRLCFAGLLKHRARTKFPIKRWPVYRSIRQKFSHRFIAIINSSPNRLVY